MLSPGMKWRIRNVPHRLRGAKAELCRLAGVGGLAELSAVVVRADGQREELGVVGRRVVTNAGAQFIAESFRNLTENETMNYHDSGTGAVAENVTDTGLGAAAGPARVAGTQSAPAGNQYRTVATISYTATLAITEHGIFSASTAGTLLDRTVFTAINVVNGDSIQFTYTLTITAGG